MIEFLAKVFTLHLIADHPWILWIVGVFAVLWVGGRILEIREDKAALQAKRQEAVNAFAAYRDRLAQAHPND